MNESEQLVREALSDPHETGSLVLEGGSFTVTNLRAILRELDEARAEVSNLRVLVSPANEQAMRDLHDDLASVTAEREAAQDNLTKAMAAWRRERDALAAKLARCEGLLREWSIGRVHTTLSDTVAYFAEQEPRT